MYLYISEGDINKIEKESKLYAKKLLVMDSQLHKKYKY